MTQTMLDPLKLVAATTLAQRLRHGRLIRPAKPLVVDGVSWGSTGELREIAHPDAFAAADVIDSLVSALRARSVSHSGEE